jgi:hypothetical protein
VSGTCTAGSSIRQIYANGNVVCETDDTGSASGTFYYTVSAGQCHNVTDGSTGLGGQCSGGGTTRTDGSSNFPCSLYGDTTLESWECPLDLPHGSRIERIDINGYDWSNGGYFEGAAYRFAHTTFGPTYISATYGGTWQNSGVAAQPGTTSVNIFSSSDTHTVDNLAARYVVGLGTYRPSGSLMVYSILVEYTIP